MFRTNRDPSRLSAMVIGQDHLLAQEEDPAQSRRWYCHVNSPNLKVGKLFVDQAACAADFYALNASSRW